MAEKILFANLASSALASSIAAAATALTVTAGTGVKFPNPGANEIFVCKIVRLTDSAYEIVHVSVRAIDNFTTIVRGQDGTTPLDFVTGDKIVNVSSKGAYERFVQKKENALVEGNIAFSGNNTHAGTETFSNILTMSGKSIIEANASIAAHATTMDPWSLGNYVSLTGAAVTFTAITAAPQAGAEVELYMNAAHTFTDGAVFEVDGDANWTAEAGDRVLMRAKTTTVVTVHPRKKTGASVSSVGVAQTWQDVAGSRAVNTNYQNTTGRTITVNVSVSRAGAGNATLLVATSSPPTVVTCQISSSGATFFMSAMVPPGHYYRLEDAGVTIVYWAELR